MKKNIYFFFTSLVVGTTIAQNVNIPDPVFKNYLLSDNSINTNADNEIQLSEAQSFNGSIYAANLNMTTPITDLSGIEAFTNIIFLDVRFNQLTSLNLSNNIALWHVKCNDNLISSIDVSQSAGLEYLYCGNNQLTSLNVSNNTALRDLGCANNQLTTLDISQNTSLENLYCNNNLLTNLNTSNNTYLLLLECDYNQLTSLDISNNTAQTRLTCNNNQLTSLNVANGLNGSVGVGNFQRFWVFDNPNLECIKVDNSQFSIANWENGTTANQDVFVYDNGVNFSESCSSAFLNESNLTTFNLFPNPASTSFTLSNLPKNATIQLVDQTGRLVKTETAILTTTTISTVDMHSGIYFVHVTGKNGKASTQKLVIE